MLNVKIKNDIFLNKINVLTLILVSLFFFFLPFGAFYNIPLVVLAGLGGILLIVDTKKIVHDRGARFFATLFACIFIPMLLSLPDAINPAETLRKISSFSVWLFVGIAVLICLRDEKNLNFLLLFLGMLLTFWVIDALWQYISGKNFLGYPFEIGKFYAPGSGRLTGIFYPDFRIGIMLAILSPLYFEFTRICQERFFLSWIMVVPFVTVILLAGSRASWVMLLLSCILYSGYVFYRGYHRKFRLKTFVIAVMILIPGLTLVEQADIYEYRVIKSFLISRISTASYKSENLKYQTALEQRIELWESALRLTTHHWINGIGVRGFRFVDVDRDLNSVAPIISEQIRVSTHPHQITLEILVETGIIGITGYIIFWILLFKACMSVIRTREPVIFLFWIIPAIIAVFPLNMHKSFYEHFSSAIIWMLLPLAIASYSIRTSPKSD